MFQPNCGRCDADLGRGMEKNRTIFTTFFQFYVIMMIILHASELIRILYHWDLVIFCAFISDHWSVIDTIYVDSDSKLIFSQRICRISRSLLNSRANEYIFRFIHQILKHFNCPCLLHRLEGAVFSFSLLIIAFILCIQLRDSITTIKCEILNSVNFQKKNYFIVQQRMKCYISKL